MKRACILLVALGLGSPLLAQDPPDDDDDKPTKTGEPAEADTKKLEGVEHFPLKVGTRWQYKMSYRLKQLGEKKDGEDAVEEGKHRFDVYVSNPQKVNGRLVAVLEWKVDANPNPAQRSYYIVEGDSVHCVRRLQGSGPHVKAWDFTPKQKVVPKVLKPGDKWSWEGTNGPDKGKQSWEVVKKETIEVPAGTYKDCFVIKSEYTGEDGSKGIQTRWLAPGVGIVKEVTLITNSRQEFRTEGLLVRFEAP